MEKIFKFEGYTYQPIGNILGGFVEKTKWFNRKKKIEYSSWQNFMKVAKKHKASCDIYLCLEDNNYYIPLNNCLASVDESVIKNKHFKSINDYKKWYK